MILASPIVNLKPTFGGRFSKPLVVSAKPYLGCSSFSTKLSPLLKWHCSNHNKDTDKSTQRFSVFRQTSHGRQGVYGAPWLCICSICIFLWVLVTFPLLLIPCISLFLIHRLSFSSSFIWHDVKECNPRVALLLLVIDILELLATLFLLNSTIRPEKRLVDIFEFNSVGRNWLLASALGFGLLAQIVS